MLGCHFHYHGHRSRIRQICDAWPARYRLYNYLFSQPESITALWQLSDTVWWQLEEHLVDNLSKVMARTGTEPCDAGFTNIGSLFDVNVGPWPLHLFSVTFCSLSMPSTKHYFMNFVHIVTQWWRTIVQRSVQKRKKYCWECGAPNLCRGLFGLAVCTVYTAKCGRGTWELLIANALTTVLCTTTGSGTNWCNPLLHLVTGDVFLGGVCCVPRLLSSLYCT